MKKSIRKPEKKNELWCPYCEDEIVNSDLPYCQACKVVLFYCPECGKPVDRKERTCPECGVDMKERAKQEIKR